MPNESNKDALTDLPPVPTLLKTESSPPIVIFDTPFKTLYQKTYDILFKEILSCSEPLDVNCHDCNNLHDCGIYSSALVVKELAPNGLVHRYLTTTVWGEQVVTHYSKENNALIIFFLPQGYRHYSTTDFLPEYAKLPLEKVIKTEKNVVIFWLRDEDESDCLMVFHGKDAKTYLATDPLHLHFTLAHTLPSQYRHGSYIDVDEGGIEDLGESAKNNHTVGFARY